MAKARNTRKQRSAELLSRLEEGPEFSALHLAASNTPFSPAEAARQYKLWAESGVIGEVQRLVPELREVSSKGR